jgi:hypothetical protein
VLLRQVLALGASLFVAELFYKFHSFTLECVAFLATWYVLDAAMQGICDIWEKRVNRS